MAIPEEVIAQIKAAPTDTLGWFEKDLTATWKHIFPITPTSVRTGNLSHGYAANFGEGSTGIEQAKAAIGCAPLGRIRVVGPGEESDRLQGVGDRVSREYANVETVPDSQSSQKVRSTLVLQRRNSGDLELYDGVETGLGGFQGPVEEVGMEHDCFNQNGI